MKYQLSRFIPMKFKTTYGVFDNPQWEGPPPRYAEPDRTMISTWWMWRHRIYRQVDVAV